MSNMSKSTQIQLKSANVSTVQHLQTRQTQLEANLYLITQAPRNSSGHIAHQLLHDTRLPSSASHLYLPCALCTSLQAFLLAFSQWWIRRSGIILDTSARSGTTRNQPARDSWWLSHAVTLAQLLPISTMRALNGKNLCETFMKLYQPDRQKLNPLPPSTTTNPSFMTGPRLFIIVPVTPLN